MVTMKGSSFLSGIGPHRLLYPAYLWHYPASLAMFPRKYVLTRGIDASPGTGMRESQDKLKLEKALQFLIHQMRR
jgi:hypothetical protein